MGHLGISRFAVLAGAIAMVAATSATCTAASDDFRTHRYGATSGTLTTHDDGTIVLELQLEPAAPFVIDIAPSVIDRRRNQGGCTPLHYRARHVAERRCMSAVQPSAGAGWRSGRVKRLASG